MAIRSIRSLGSGILLLKVNNEWVPLVALMKADISVDEETLEITPAYALAPERTVPVRRKVNFTFETGELLSPPILPYTAMNASNRLYTAHIDATDSNWAVVADSVSGQTTLTYNGLLDSTDNITVIAVSRRYPVKAQQLTVTSATLDTTANTTDIVVSGVYDIADWHFFVTAAYGNSEGWELDFNKTMPIVEARLVVNGYSDSGEPAIIDYYIPRLQLKFPSFSFDFTSPEVGQSFEGEVLGGTMKVTYSDAW